MKFSMLTIAGALATANAASFRGDTAATLKKMALMQKFTDAANKNTFGAVRRLQDEDVSSETVMQPFSCITAKVYNAEGGEQQEDSGSGPYMSYVTWQFETSANNGAYEYNYGADDEFTTTLSAYLMAIGSSWAEERANLCDDCDSMQDFCEMDDNERSFFSEMSEDEFQQYIEEHKEEEEQNNAYAAYNYGNGNGGRRNLFESIDTLCSTCEEHCMNHEAADQTRDLYQSMQKMFEEEMCTRADNGNFIGHTCGSDGTSIELAMFTDEDCTYLSEEQNAYDYLENTAANMYNWDADADGDGQPDNNWDERDLAFGYMVTVTNMFSNQFSCQVGAIREYGGSDPDEACANLYETAASKNQCAYNGQNQNGRGLQDEEEVPYGYDFVYSEDINDVCGKIFAIESEYAVYDANNGEYSGFSSGWTNPFTGMSFVQQFKLDQANLSGGAIAGIVIAVAVVWGIVAAAFIKKRKTGKDKVNDLEEPVFQGGVLQ